MERIIYHGSEFIIEKPTLGKGNQYNDYGLGFYCTSDKSLAKEWASKESGYGFINCYSIRDDRLKILDLTKPPFDDVLYWVTLLITNRKSSRLDNYPREIEYLKEHYLIDVTKYDVVIGYRADDSYFLFPEAFVRSEITLESLNAIFKAGDLGKQYVLISKRAFSLLKFKGYEETNKTHQQDYYSRKKEADKVFKDLLLKDRYSSKPRMRDFIKND